jgi:succinoglycan biosynthesis protein ExoL
MKVLFILPVLSDSYYRKRIDNLSKMGLKFKVSGFDRTHYEGKPWNTETVQLGRIEHTRYFSRTGIYAQSILKLHREMKDCDVIYSFNLDTLFLGWLASFFSKKNVRFIYDVADIRDVLVSRKIFGLILRTLESFLLKSTDLIVCASPEYLPGYFKKIQGIDKPAVIIENKVDPELVPESVENPFTGPKSGVELSIGYFGMIRCKKSMQLLLSILEQADHRYQLNLRGKFLVSHELKERVMNLKNVHYGGTFRYPDDLKEMYQSVDLVWAAHMHGVSNSKWAISNRFYQACAFKRPLIGQIGTQDAIRIQKYQIGININLNEFEKSIESLNNINSKHLKTWFNKLTNVPKEVYCFQNEHQKLFDKMNRLNSEK